MANHIEIWLSVASQFDYETDRFTLDLDRLTDAELTEIKGVSEDFLQAAPLVFQSVHPRELPRLRGIISYLQYLRDLQSDAWKRTLVQYREEADNLNQSIERR